MSNPREENTSRGTCIQYISCSSLPDRESEGGRMPAPAWDPRALRTLDPDLDPDPSDNCCHHRDYHPRCRTALGLSDEPSLSSLARTGSGATLARHPSRHRHPSEALLSESSHRGSSAGADYAMLDWILKGDAKGGIKRQINEGIATSMHGQRRACNFKNNLSDEDQSTDKICILKCTGKPCGCLYSLLSQFCLH